MRLGSGFDRAGYGGVAPTIHLRPRDDSLADCQISISESQLQARHRSLSESSVFPTRQGFSQGEIRVLDAGRDVVETIPFDDTEKSL